MNTCSHNTCKGKPIKLYNYCIKHLKNQIAPKTNPTPCPDCRNKDNVKQYCCGHWMHEACLIKTGKAHCIECNKIVYVSNGVLKQIKIVADEQKELDAFPLLVSFEIDISKDDAVKSKYSTRDVANFKHEKLHVTEMVKLLKRQLIDNMYVLDIALLMNTRDKEFPDIDERSDHIDKLCKETIDRIMKNIHGILPNSKYRYVPIKIIPSVNVYAPARMVRKISFYCAIRDQYTGVSPPVHPQVVGDDVALGQQEATLAIARAQL